MNVKLDKIIKIQKRIFEDNGNGVDQEKWEDFLKLFASANNLYGREYWQAAAVQAETTVQFITLYTPKFKEVNIKNFRIVFNDTIYDIIPPIDNIKYENRYVKLRGKLHE